jgi:hypothetical protein
MTDRQGYFCIFNPEPGSYNITQMQYKIEAGAGWIQISDKSEIPLHIKVEPAEVINMGFLHWIAINVVDKENSNRFLSKLQLDDHPEQLKTEFAERFPNSLWLQRKWVDIDIILVD